MTGWVRFGRVTVAVAAAGDPADRKSTRLNSSHSQKSYAVFCLKKNNERDDDLRPMHLVLDVDLDQLRQGLPERFPALRVDSEDEAYAAACGADLAAVGTCLER